MIYIQNRLNVGADMESARIHDIEAPVSRNRRRCAYLKLSNDFDANDNRIYQFTKVNYMKKNYLCDFHLHTMYSLDSNAGMKDMCDVMR